MGGPKVTEFCGMEWEITNSWLRKWFDLRLSTIDCPLLCYRVSEPLLNRQSFSWQELLFSSWDFCSQSPHHADVLLSFNPLWLHETVFDCFNLKTDLGRQRGAPQPSDLGVQTLRHQGIWCWPSPKSNASFPTSCLHPSYHTSRHLITTASALPASCLKSYSAFSAQIKGIFQLFFPAPEQTNLDS